MVIVHAAGSFKAGIAFILLAMGLSLTARAELPVDGAWVEIGPPVGSIGGLAADPNDPDLVIAAPRSRWVFRSTDGGASWERGAPLSFGNRTNTLRADHQVAGLFYALSSFTGSFRRSTDGGQTWETLDIEGSATFLATDPGSAGVLFVGTTNAGLFRSSDSGTTMTRIDADDEIFSGVRITSIAVDPSDGNRVFIGTQGQSPGVVRGVFDNGEWTFESVNDGLFNPSSAAVSIDADGEVYAQVANNAYRFNPSEDEWDNLFHPDSATHLQADPRHSGIVFSGNSDGLFRTTTGGGSGDWEHELDEAIVRPEEFAFSETPLVATAGFGVYRRDADSPQSGGWQPSNEGMNAGVVTSVLVDPDIPGRYLAGVGGATLMESLDEGQTWSPIGDGLESGQSVSNLQASTLLCGRFFASQGSDVYLSNSAGSNWTNLDPNGDIEQSVQSLIELDATRVLVASFNAVLIGDFSNTGSVDWGEQLDGLPADATFAGVVQDPVSERFYALTRRDGLFTSELDNGSLSWTPVPDEQQGNPTFSNILLDSSGRYLFGTTSVSTGHIYRLDLDDPGGVFERVEHDLPGSSLLILFQPTEGGRLVANINQDGSFFSEDHGETWQPLGQPFPFRLFDLVEDIHNPGQYLAATETASVARLIGDRLLHDRFEASESGSGAGGAARDCR